ncbi:MAG: mechanosensitive ion channel family protein [Proteobacteria bacterium]|nr:mechanosensitive ion channel family protein [Pseudomonadota bacterium]MBU1640158.1 mechanosensitive ion channel family protein [Pseudomonadota bacterium]
MNGLDVVENLYKSKPWLAIVLSIVVFVWVPGSHLRVWRRLRRLFPLGLALIDLVVAPLTVAFVFTLLRNFLVPDFLPAPWFTGIFYLVFCLTISWYVAKGSYTVVARRYIGERSSHPQSIPGLLRSVIYGACLLLGVGFFLWVQGYSLTGIWISTGLLTALIAFALQQTLGDFFSGLALGLEGSFRIGDWLQLENGSEGQVVDLNWRATWLRCWDNTTQVIPNAKLAGQGFKNLHGEHHHYRPWYYVQIPAEVDPRFAKELLLEAAFNCKTVLKNPAPIIRLTNASTLPYTYMLWVSFANYPAMFRGREELYREIHYVLKRAGVTPAAEIHEWRSRKAKIPSAEAPTIQLALRSLELFYSLDDDEIAQITMASEQVHYDVGATILLEGDCRDALDIVASGIVDSKIELPNGQVVKIGEFAAGEYFGLISMFTDQPAGFTYSAQTDVTLIRVDLDCIQEVLKNHHDLADRYAVIIKQRLDEAELLRLPFSPTATTATLQQVKRLVKNFIMTGRP